MKTQWNTKTWEGTCGYCDRTFTEFRAWKDHTDAERIALVVQTEFEQEDTIGLGNGVDIQPGV